MKRYFPPGSEWLYYKIYLGYTTSDQILTEVVYPFTENLKERNLIDKWFFIRYNDPDYHIRIRFHILNVPENIGKIITEFEDKLSSYFVEGKIWKIQIDTYKREIERYSIENIELSENVFYFQSKLILEFLKTLENYENEGDNRWLFSMKAIENLLNIFDYSLDNKIKLMESLKVSFKREFGDSKVLSKQLNTKYRFKRETINELILKNNNEIDSLFIEHNSNINNILGNITQNLDELHLHDLLSSHIHMLMNRLFRTNNRKFELVIYDFMYHQYLSYRARNNKF